MKAISHKLHDVNLGTQWADEVHFGWNYDDFLKNNDWKSRWISFDCLLLDKKHDLIHTGITSFAADITKAFNRKTGEFIDTGFSNVVAKYDAKFHRSLVKREKDGCIYAAIALLHCVDHYNDAPGGAICKYDPKTNTWEKLCIPIPHAYIQNITLDEKNDCLYCLMFPPECIVRYDLNNGKTENLGLISSGIAGMAQGENCELDKYNNLWGTWKITRAWANEVGENASRLFRIPPGGNIEFFQFGLPKPDGSFGYVKPEGFMNLGDGYMYASADNGSIYRIDVDTFNIDYLFTPVSDRRSRLASLAVAPDGFAYGITGRDGKCELLQFDFINKSYKLMGDVVDQDGEPCWQVHYVCVTDDGVLYAGENDVPYRSGYLWEIPL